MLARAWAWLVDLLAAWRDPLDVWPDDEDTFPDSDTFSDRIPLNADCPDTQPTDWGQP
jgi:hypothetical protein